VRQLDTAPSGTEVSRCCQQNKPDEKREGQDTRINQEVMNINFFVLLALFLHYATEVSVELFGT
jgi:hypothetical protein